MKLVLTLILASLLSKTKGQDVQTSEEDVNVKKSCYYCGITDNCELPYDTEDATMIECEKSCMKFDGQAVDGKRIVVRNCGYFLANECIEGAFFENEDTIGTICHCIDSQCNSAINLCSSSLMFILILVFLWR